MVDDASDAERRLNDLGLPIKEFDFSDQANPGISGFASITPVGEAAHEYRLYVLPGTSTEHRALFAEWALSRIGRFHEHGPEPDGWQARKSDDGWQLWARLVELPPLN